MALIQRIGTNKAGPWRATADGRMTFEYGAWVGMLRRCTDPKYQSEQPTYIPCQVDGAFLDFQDFCEWASLQQGFRLAGWQLDKDLLFKGNKLYSPNTCLFVPEEVNKVLPNSKAKRGLLPIGVEKHGRWYRAKVGGTGRQERFGPFATPEAAFECYKTEKKRVLAQLAEKYAVQIGRRAYEALLNYDINIGD